MTREIAKRIVKGITDKIECNTADIDDWAEFWGFTREEYEEFLDMPIKTLEQEPFINIPCISSGVCEHDKNKVLDKIRAEIENDWQLKKYPSSPFSCGLRRAIEIIDKYKAERNDK